MEVPRGSLRFQKHSCTELCTCCTEWYNSLFCYVNKNQFQYWKPILLPDFAGAQRVQTRPLFRRSLTSHFNGSIAFVGRTILLLGIKSFKLEDPRITGIERRTSAVELFDLLYLFSFHLLIPSPCILWYKRSKSTKMSWWIWGNTMRYTDYPSLLSSSQHPRWDLRGHPTILQVQLFIGDRPDV